MSRGRWPKAELWRVSVGGEEWVVKDFRPRGFFTRHLIGALLARREALALQRLAGVPGVPAGAFLVDRFALAYRFVPGVPLASIPGREQPKELFEALEETMRQVHARGIAHLDIRNCRNVIVSEGNRPVLLDFESHLGTGGVLSGLRGALERFDLGGVYKHWRRAKPATLGPEREALLEDMNRWRKAWVFRGMWFYPRELGKLRRRIAARFDRGKESEEGK
jgi:RIO-like serine/threonine protein kinase